ncbi:hydroxymethylpyrimidine/phosphomethylpyrimidine kinase [Chryseobacterium cheonjiense]|uniref:hydroxymethylpyrimidine kinase n=1 Tax=Chryseobacterium cheonjiense TaxID=2728845 RepID=A0A7Y0FJM4_9FLAO|nr:hydroxymethylpyrimidine/phosphomethylpyrimidine kinase [Chryseobacterium cheonjiense]NML58541.1 hydroxymethylpyrimidine/phosphomethylpyrimidine kinase [Chryseobacterium cheonjiense]
MQAARPFVMSIAGFDPSGGAGLLADVKTFEQLKVQGLAVCTAMTLQTESEFFGMRWQPLEEILNSIHVLMKNYDVKAVKIGVVKDAEFLNEIIKTIKLINSETKIVWDPVLKSTSEFSFFDLNTISPLKHIIQQINLITPNYNEYNILKEAGLFEEPHNLCSILMKGGHREDKIGTDILIQNGKEIFIEPSDTFSGFYPKHGSGCVLSSAIAGCLALGKDIEQACRSGKLYIEKFLTSTPALLGFHSRMDH